MAFKLIKSTVGGCPHRQNPRCNLLARVAMGVGEAGRTTPAISLITDYLPPAERTRALPVYSFVIPVGSP